MITKWMLSLGIISFLFVMFFTSIEAVKLTPQADIDILAGSNDNTNVGAATIWFQLAQSIRKSKQIDTAQTSHYYEAINKGDFMTVLSAIWPAFLLAFIAIVCAIFVCITCPIVSCCCVCNTCNKCWKRDEIFDEKQKKMGKVAIGIAWLFSLLILLGGVGTAYMTTTTITQATSIPYSALNYTNARVIALPTSFDGIVVGVTNVINGTLPVAINAIANDPNFATIKNAIAAIIASISVIKSDFNAIKSSGNTMQSDINTLSTNAGTLISNGNSFLNDVQALFHTITYSGYTYAVQNSFNKSSDIPSSLTASGVDPNAFPNVTSMITNTISSIDLDAITDPLTSRWKNGNGVQDGFNSAITSAQGQIPEYVKFVTNYRPQIVSASASYSKMITGYQDSVAASTSSIPSYSTYAFYGEILIAALPILCVALMSLCIGFKKSKGVSCCLTMIIPLAALYFLLAFILYLVATVLYTGCTVVFDRKLQDVPSSIFDTKTSFAVSGLNLTVSSAFNVIDNCHQGQTILQATSAIGVDQNYGNMTKLINEQVNKLGIAALINGLNLGQKIRDLLPLNSSQITGPLNGFGNSSALNINIAAFLNTSDITAKINNINGVLTDLRTNVNGASPDTVFTYTTPASPSAGDKSTMKSHYLDMIDSDKSSLQTLNSSSSITYLRNAAALLQQDLHNLNTTIFATIADGFVIGHQVDIFFASLVNYADTLNVTISNTAIPAAKVYAGAQSQILVDKILTTTAECQTVANDILATKNVVCLSMIHVLDGLWWTCFASGVLIVFCLWFFTCASRRLAMKPYESPEMELEMGYNNDDKKDYKNKDNDGAADNNTENVLRTRPLYDSEMQTRNSDQMNSLPGEIRSPNLSRDEKSQVRRPSDLAY